MSDAEPGGNRWGHLEPDVASTRPSNMQEVDPSGRARVEIIRRTVEEIQNRLETRTLEATNEFWGQDWAEACSICFTNRCDFSLPGCMDQFCRPCIRRYFTDKIHASWGLSVLRFSCPVCYDPVPFDIVARYIDSETCQLYHKYNNLRRNVHRHCPKCQSQVSVTDAPPMDNDAQQHAWKSFELELQNHLSSNVAVDELLSQYRVYLDGGVSAIDFYNMLVAQCRTPPPLRKDSGIGNSETEEVFEPRVLRQKRQKTQDKHPRSDNQQILQEEQVRRLIAQAVSVCPNVDRRLCLQYLHVKEYPDVKCPECCAEFCFQCGECNPHRGITCEEYMVVMSATLRAKLAASSTASPVTRKRARAMEEQGLDSMSRADLEQLETDLAAVDWKLTHSKRCPQCWLTVIKGEGCNKCDCPYCDFQFCWECLRPWALQCGFYQCGVGENSTKQHEPSGSAKAEPGVPDVTAMGFGRYGVR